MAPFRTHYCQVRKLVETNHVDVNIMDDDMRTPLHLAASQGRKAVTEYLLNQSADVSHVDRWGHSALHNAVREVLDWLPQGPSETDELARSAVTQWLPSSANMEPVCSRSRMGW